jgi:CO/xanthine dehydrogenase Mo-binding subunit
MRESSITAPSPSPAFAGACFGEGRGWGNPALRLWKHPTARSGSASTSSSASPYFRPDTLPPGFQAARVATRHDVPRVWPFAFTNGIQASHVEVDVETGEVTLLKHWSVEDCGTVINPQLVDEQVRGGVVQGLGAASHERASTTPTAAGSS